MDLVERRFFSYEFDGPTLTLTLRRIDELHPHEETMPGGIAKLVSRLRKEGVLRHPVLVDSKTLTVLDGMHRLAAARELGLDRIVACEIDYENPRVPVFRTFRTFASLDSIPARIFTELELKRTCLEEAIEALETGEAGVALLLRDFALVSRAHVPGSAPSSRLAWAVERLLSSAGYHPSYESEFSALSKLNSGRATLVVAHRPIEKREVVEAALSGDLFAPKSTYHVAPARPLFLNVDLKLLSASTPLEEAVDALAKRLKGATCLAMPPGFKIGSRSYDEPVLFLIKGPLGDSLCMLRANVLARWRFLLSSSSPAR